MNMDHSHEKEKHVSQKCGRQPCVLLQDDAQGGGNKRSAHEINPKCVQRHPGRNDTRDFLGIDKMVCA